MYNVAISIYSFFVRLVAPFHEKANLMTRGHKETFEILKKEIDPNCKYVWFHVA